MNHYLPSAFNYKEFNSKIITRTEDLQKGSLRWKDYIQNILSQPCNLCSSHGHVSSFCPHCSAPGPNYYLTLGAITRPLQRHRFGRQVSVTVGLKERTSEGHPSQTFDLHKLSDFTSPEKLPLVFQTGDNTELWGFVCQVKPV